MIKTSFRRSVVLFTKEKVLYIKNKKCSPVYKIKIPFLRLLLLVFDESYIRALIGSDNLKFSGRTVDARVCGIGALRLDVKVPPVLYRVMQLACLPRRWAVCQEASLLLLK